MQVISFFKKVFYLKKRQCARKRYQNLTEEEYGRKRYKNLSEDEKQRLVEYRKRYCEMRKNKNLL